MSSALVAFPSTALRAGGSPVRQAHGFASADSGTAVLCYPFHSCARRAQKWKDHNRKVPCCRRL